MSSASIDSLTWIKAELERTLEAARRRLDAYAEERDDPALFDEFIDHTHQVAGTFAMLEVRGGRMLAEHGESLARAVRDERVPGSPEAFELLMRSNLELTDYLDRMVSGMPDSPSALLSTTNEVRALLGDEPLERDRLAPRRHVPTPDKPSGEDLVGLAVRLRSRYQAALLDFYRDRQRHRAVAQMRDVVARLESAAASPPVFEFFWVAGAVFEALAEKALAPSLAVNRVLGQLERELKRLATGSEAAMAEAPPELLVSRMLGELGGVQEAGERVAAVRESFSVGESDLDSGGGVEAGPGATLLHTAGSAVLEDLARVRDRIDIFVRTGSRNPPDLAPLADTLRKIGEALGMLGLDLAKHHVEHECEAVREISSRSSADEVALLALATGLISVESDVEAYLAGAGDNPQALAEHNARFAGLREALAEISRVKDIFNEFLRTSSQSLLQPLPEMVARLARTLDFLALGEASAPIRRIGAYIVRVQSSRDVPEREDLDRLADAVVSVEYYLETLQHGRQAPASMLENADHALQALQVGEADVEANLPKARAAVPPEPPEGEAGSDRGAPTAGAGHEEKVREAEAVESEAAGGGEAPGGDLEAAPELPPVREAGADPEIVSVFLDEASEVVEAIRQSLPAWRADPGDREALTVIRRSFHTLKGSGRMVGAQRLGEFAWAYENLLNRVIDYTLPPAEPIVAAVGEAAEALPALLAQFDGDTQPQADVPELFARAWKLVQGRGLAAPEDADAAEREAGAGADVEEAAPQGVAANAETSGSEEGPAGVEPEPGHAADAGGDAGMETRAHADREPESAPAPRLERSLYEAYRRETEQQLASIEEWLEACDPGEPAAVSDDLCRAVHTLAGSADLAGVQEMQALFAPLEAVLERIAQAGVDSVQRLPERLAETQSTGRAVLIAYGDATLAMPDWPPVVERTNAFKRQVAFEACGEKAAAGRPREKAVEAGAGAPDRESPAAAGAPEAGSGRRAESADRDEKPRINVVDLAAQEDYDPELGQIFVSEANELLDSSDVAAHAWSQDHDLTEPLSELQRSLHTLKGGARMAGVSPVSNLTHELETVLARVADGRIGVSDDLLRLVERTLDHLHRMLAHVLSDGKVAFDATLVAELRRYLGIEVRASGPAPQDRDAAAGAPELRTDAEDAEAHVVADDAQTAGPEPPEEAAAAGAGSLAASPGPQPAQRVRHEMARVRADLLEASINNTGEVSIYRARIEEHLRSMNVHIAELDRTADRLRDQLRELEAETEAQILSSHERRPETPQQDFDPLEFDRYTRIQELSRSLAEAVSDLTSLRGLFASDLNQANVLLDRQGRVNADLQDALMRTRMVPFSLSAPRLRRLVRRVAEEAGKPVDFEIRGAEGEMDRQLVRHILPALEHLLRNAVAHGVEAPERRRELGKPETARITLVFKRDGGDMVIEVADDGRGLDLAAIRAKAIEQGLIEADSALGESELADLIFHPGFSTSAHVTQTAGRGVGMDVVAAEARQAGGSAELETEPGKGMRCRMRLPTTLAITQTLLVQVGQRDYPVALASITGIARLSRDELAELFSREEPAYEYGGESYALVSLAEIFSEPLPPEDERGPRQPLLLVNSGGRRVALVAEDMSGSREVVVKAVGPQVAGIPGIAGATVFGDGSIGLLLDLTSLVRGLASLERVGPPRAAEPRGPAVAPSEPLVLVVDDSITVRRVTQRLLERNGMRAVTAKDGIDALDLLQETRPDVMLIDIEMPRMDGYELASHVKNDNRLRSIPIIVITSRTGEKHRARARQIGIEDYLGKPYQDTDLIAAVEGYLPRLSAPASTSRRGE